MDAGEQRKRKSRLTDKAIIEALRKSAGIVASAADKLGVHRSTLKRRIDKSEKLQAEKEEVTESLLDLCDIATVTLVRRGAEKVLEGGEPNKAETAHIFHYYNTRGKHRHSAQKVDVNVPDGITKDDAPVFEVVFVKPEAKPDGNENTAGGTGSI